MRESRTYGFCEGLISKGVSLLDCLIKGTSLLCGLVNKYFKNLWHYPYWKLWKIFINSPLSIKLEISIRPLKLA